MITVSVNAMQDLKDTLKLTKQKQTENLYVFRVCIALNCYLIHYYDSDFMQFTYSK